jgi:hypothetical protein
MSGAGFSLWVLVLAQFKPRRLKPALLQSLLLPGSDASIRRSWSFMSVS